MQPRPTNSVFRRAVIPLAAIVLIWLAAVFNNRLQAMKVKEEEASTVRAEATSVMATQVALKALSTYAVSDQAAVDWARGEGRFIKEGDRPILPVAAVQQPSVMLTPLAPTSTPIPNWQLWLRVFFGP